MEWAGRVMSASGYLTCWIIPNPISAFLISWGNITRWAIMHHICHGGYDQVPGIPSRYTSKGFARGLRRYVDWFDWMLPEAWNYEHNILHHYNTGELTDPDLVEENFSFIRNSKLPMPLKYLAVFGAAITWKFTYYAPNTLRYYMDLQKNKSKKSEKEKTLAQAAPTPEKLKFFDLLTFCLLPYSLMRFGIIPLLFLPLGLKSVFNVLITSILAEIFTNFHAFMVIVPNHTGDDVTRFATKIKNKSEYFYRQIVGSVNYNCGDDFTDMAHLWLNYQIEHHIWPDLPMLKYQQYQKRVKALCLKHHIPYIQGTVLHRFKKMTDIMVGNTSMIRGPANNETGSIC